MPDAGLRQCDQQRVAIRRARRLQQHVCVGVGLGVGTPDGSSQTSRSIGTDPCALANVLIQIDTTKLTRGL